MKRILICLFCLVMIFNFNGCSLFEEYYPEKELFTRSTIDSDLYVYSGNVRLKDSNDYTDSLELRNEESDDNKKSFYESYTILDGHFQYFAWNDFKLFILKNNLYYVFDIKSYSYPPVDDDGNKNYELLMYTEEEFRTLYPYYTSFEWIKCITPDNSEEDLSIERKWIVSKLLPFSLPDNAKLREYTEHTAEDKTQNYIKGKVAICIDDLSMQFDERIANEWIKPVKDDKYFDKLNEYVFKNDFIVYNEDYYYFYDNPQIGSKTTDLYYQDGLNVFAYDKDMMILYFYICK